MIELDLHGLSILHARKILKSWLKTLYFQGKIITGNSLSMHRILFEEAKKKFNIRPESMSNHGAFIVSRIPKNHHTSSSQKRVQ